MLKRIVKELKVRPVLLITIQAIIILFFSNVITHLIFPLYVKYTGVFHSFMELLCIIFASTSFLVIWCRYYSNSSKNQIVSLGFLSIAIFDLLHTFYSATLGFAPKNYLDLSTRFWIISRITEAILLLFITTDLPKAKINKWLGLSVSLIYSVGVSYLILFHKSIFPILYTTEGIPNTKILLEYIIIFILIFALWNLKSKVNIKDTFTYRYIALTILLFVPAELCFTLYKSLTAFVVIYGHVLKVGYYMCLFKGIVETEINYPYVKLEETNKQLKDILNAIPLAIHTYDDDVKLTFANKKFEELLQCKMDSIVGLTGKEVLSIIKKINYEEEIILPNNSINKDEGIKNIVRTYQTPEGKRVKLLVNIHKIQNGVIFISSEATREQAIDNLNLQTQTILDAMLSPSMILDVNNTITACNLAFENLLDLKKSDIIGTNIRRLNEMVKFNNKIIVDKLFQGSLEDEPYEGSLISMKGIKKEIIGQVSSIYNVENEKIGIISVMQDITEIKQNQEKLINQEKLALLGQMGATIVHDTRNFLTTIKGSSQLIELHSDDEKVKKYANKIRLDTDEVNRIISDFLTLSKPTNVDVEEVSIHDLLLSMKRMLQTSSLIKGISVDFIFKHDERYVLCDEVKIRQVILNICKNAIEAMDNVKHPCLKIETGIDEFANEAYVRITDNGKGIPKDILEKLGTPFFTTKKNGTGLGLNACFQIIKDHKGKIDIQSKLNVGTTFTIVLPCLDEDEEDSMLT